MDERRSYDGGRGRHPLGNARYLQRRVAEAAAVVQQVVGDLGQLGQAGRGRDGARVLRGYQPHHRDPVPSGLQRQLDDQRVPARVRDHPAQVARPPVQAPGELLVVAGLVLQLPGGLRVGARGEFGVPQRPNRLDAPRPPVHLADQGQRMTGAERVDVPPGQDRRGDRGGHAVDGRVVLFQRLIEQPHDVPPPGPPHRPLRSHVPTLRKPPPGQQLTRTPAAPRVSP